MTARSRRAAVPVLALLLAGFSPFEREQEDVRAGNERLAAGDAAGARARYDAAEAAVGARPEIDFDRGDALLAEGRPAEAAEAFRRAAKDARPPLASRALQNLGSALAASGDREGARRALEGALLADPANDDARWNLEVLLRGASSSPEPGPGDAGAPHPGPPPAQRGEGGERAPAGKRGDREGTPPAQQGEASHAPPPAQRGEVGRGAVSEPLSRQEAERLLEALRAREKRAPLFGRERPRDAGRADAAKEW